MKNQQQKKANVLLGGVFAPEGMAVNLLDSFSDFVILNVLCVICSLPVFTAGASLSAAFQCSRKLRHREGSGALKTFFQTWKLSFCRVTPVWLVMVAFFALFRFELSFVGNMAPQTGTLFRCVLNAATLLWLGLLVWVIPVLNTFDISLRAAVKTAAALAIANLPQTLLMMLITLIPYLTSRLISGTLGVILLLLLIFLTEGIILINSIICDNILNKI